MASPVKATPAHWLQYVVGRAILLLVALLPLAAARAFGRMLGRIAYWPLGVRRHTVVRQVAAAFPDSTPKDVSRISRGAYAHLGELMVELAVLPRFDREGILGLFEGEEGFDGIIAARDEGRGIILITGHIGNYELAAAYVNARGVPIECIVRRLNNPLFDRYVHRTRTRSGMVVVYDQDAVRRTPRALREGRAVAFVADQGVKGLASTFVPFFGRPAKTPRGAAVFAKRGDLPTFFVAALRQPGGKYRCVVTPVEIPETGDRERDVDEIVARYTNILEDWVRRYPEQYFWHHRRWKRQPEDTPDELRDPVIQGQGSGVKG